MFLHLQVKVKQASKGETQSPTHEEICSDPEELSEFLNLYQPKPRD